MEKSVYLILENGTVFRGKSFGASHDVTGEVVFTTSMTGYVETLTDPSYYGQIVIQTFPMIGNYGVMASDFEGDAPKLSAYIVREWCHDPSNFRCEGDLDAFLKASNVVGMYGIDTRALTKIIRDCGTMNARITTTLPEDLTQIHQEIHEYRVKDAVESVTCKEVRVYKAEQEKYKVVLWDFGAKRNIIRKLQSKGCTVTCVPASTTAEEIMSYHPDGIMLSNGPGDPAENTAIIAELKKLCEYRVPTFGICLGHQLLALSQGAKTTKLQYGHRGANQPVRDMETGKVYITSQNHGYAVETSTIPDYAKACFINANDHTNEGITYLNMPVFSVQFHPEACGGPRDTMFLFDRFTAMMDQNR